MAYLLYGYLRSHTTQVTPSFCVSLTQRCDVPEYFTPAQIPHDALLCTFPPPIMYPRCMMYRNVSFGPPSGVPRLDAPSACFLAVFSRIADCCACRIAACVARLRVGLCGARPSQGGRVVLLVLLLSLMEPSSAPPGSGTNLNSCNSTPDDSSPAHHTTQSSFATCSISTFETCSRAKGFWNLSLFFLQSAASPTMFHSHLLLPRSR